MPIQWLPHLVHLVPALWVAVPLLMAWISHARGYPSHLSLDQVVYFGSLEYRFQLYGYQLYHLVNDL